MKKGMLKRILIMLMAFILCMTVPVKAYASGDENVESEDGGDSGQNTGNDEVDPITEAANGVVCILVSYNANGTLIPVQTGTGFLINDETVITCNHVVTFDDQTVEALQEEYGTDENGNVKTAAEIRDGLVIQVFGYRDVKIEADLKNSSEEMDFAILNLGDSLSNRTYLTLRHSSEIGKTDPVYALGFPGRVLIFQNKNTYTADDVTVTNGQVSKVTTLIDNVDYVQHSATLNTGNSGGPLIDSNGAVIGINAMKSGDEFEEAYYYSIAIDQLIETLESLGVEYTMWSEPEPEPEPDKTVLSKMIEEADDLRSYDYTEDSYKPVRHALREAEKLADKDDVTQEEIDAAVTALTEAMAGLQDAPSFPWLLVGLIAGGVVLLIVIIVIVVKIVKKSKKKKEAESHSTVPTYSPVSSNPASPYTGPTARPINGFDAVSANPATNFFASGVGSGETSVLNAGAGETTILSAGAGETTVLKPNMSMGTLIRARGGERIVIGTDNFVIGKERSRVNYCITDNTSISRTHARFTCRGGMTYITDLKTTNGTFLNGVKIQPNQEKQLKNGDRIALADEEFTYTL